VRVSKGFEFESVSFEPNGVPVLRDVSLTIPGRGVTVIAGPSGSGKSTLLRMGNRLEVPTRGRVLLDGVDTASFDPLALRRRCGMVFQHPVRFGGTAADNLRVARPEATDTELGAALERVWLGRDLLERQADDLSGGEAQRMCIARTLLTEPSILLCDEATSALDVDARSAIEELVVRLAESGTAVVWVTHDLHQAQRLGDRVAVIIGGRVVPTAVAERCLAQGTFEGLPLDPGSHNGND